VGLSGPLSQGLWMGISPLNFPHIVSAKNMLVTGALAGDFDFFVVFPGTDLLVTRLYLVPHEPL